jgi:hypothetical protein
MVLAVKQIENNININHVSQHNLLVHVAEMKKSNCKGKQHQHQHEPCRALSYEECQCESIMVGGYFFE